MTNDIDLFHGLTEEDMYQFYEMLGILGMAVFVILFIVQPLIHLSLANQPQFLNKLSQVSQPNMTFRQALRPALKILFEEYRKSLRATLLATVLYGGLVILATALIVSGTIYVKSSSYCAVNEDVCDVWTNASLNFLLIGLGLFAFWVLYDFVVRRNSRVTSTLHFFSDCRSLSTLSMTSPQVVIIHYMAATAPRTFHKTCSCMLITQRSL